jgi:2-dehydropantoate 2-reductase
MYVAVIGAGAIGSVLGALLTRSGHKCVFISRSAHLAAMRAEGLRLSGAVGTLSLSVEAAPRLTVAPDLALLTTKAPDVVDAVRANLGPLGGAPVLVVQNGLRGIDLLRPLLPPEQIIGAVAVMAATYLAPGRVGVPYLGSMVIGRAAGPPDGAVTAVARVLGDALPTFVTENLRGAQWTKLLINLNNALAALTDLDDQDMLRAPALARLGRSLVREGLQVAEAAGVRLESLPGVPADVVRLLSRLPSPVSAWLARCRARRLAVAGPVVLSSLQSVRRHRPTEVDYLNGEVVRTGRQFGVAAPLNERVVSLVHDVERTRRRYTPEDLAGLLCHP